MKFLWRWGPAIIWMALIFFGSTRERVSVSPDYWSNFLFFKMLHVIEYAVLFFWFVRGTKKKRMAFLLTVLFATTDEFHQLFVTTREGTVRDVIIDALGAGLAWITLKTLLPKLPKKLQRWGRALLAP